jgi:hypothetical protein
MNRSMRALLLLACLVSAVPLIAKPAKTPEAYQAQAEQIVAQTLEKIPAYALLAQQQKDFIPAWQELLRQQLIIGGSRQAQEFSRAIALGLALHSSNGFLSAADDDSVNRYFQQQRRLLADAQQDPRLCRLLLNTPSARMDQAGAPPWLMEKKYRAYQPGLQQAMTELIVNAQGKWPRTLPDEQSSLFIRRVVGQMVDTYGPESLKRYELMGNENASPETRCLALHQLYETIDTLPLELRAQVVRGYFGQD